MFTSYDATTVTTDGIVHKVSLGETRIGHVIKTENKETPFTVVDTVGSSGNFETLNEAVRAMCIACAVGELPTEERYEFLASLIAMKLTGALRK